jgi:hypothetical protein
MTTQSLSERLRAISDHKKVLAAIRATLVEKVDD